MDNPQSFVDLMTLLSAISSDKLLWYLQTHSCDAGTADSVLEFWQTEGFQVSHFVQVRKSISCIQTTSRLDFWPKWPFYYLPLHCQ